MKFLIVFLTFAVAAYASPYYAVPQSGQQSGSMYGGQQHDVGASGFGQQGQQTGAANNFHDRGHQQSNFREIKEGSSSSSHDVGGGSQFGSAGGQSGGFNNHNQGQSGFGQQGGGSFLQG